MSVSNLVSVQLQLLCGDLIIVNRILGMKHKNRRHVVDTRQVWDKVVEKSRTQALSISCNIV